MAEERAVPVAGRCMWWSRLQRRIARRCTLVFVRRARESMNKSDSRVVMPWQMAVDWEHACELRW